jgi:fibronectin-binding autotransporter adhesin
MKFTFNRQLIFSVAAFYACCAFQLHATIAASGPIITGAGAGAGSHVKRFDGVTLAETASFFAYGPSVTQGVRVAAGDVNGDGTADLITSLGDGAPSHVKAFSGADLSELRSFFAYGGFTGGVYVASGDVNGDNFDDIITGAGAGGNTHVKVFSGATGLELQSFFAYPGVNVDVRVAAGDVNGDGKADIITGLGSGAAPHIKVFDGVSQALLYSFFALPSGFTGGVYVAGGDVTGDGFADIIVGAGEGGGSNVRIFNGTSGSDLGSLQAFPGATFYEVRVAAGDVNGDGRDDIIAGLGPSPSGGPQVRAFSGIDSAVLQSYFAYNQSFAGGVYVAGSLVVPEPATVLSAGVGAILLIGRRKNLKALRLLPY